MRANPHYAYCRDLGQLHCARVFVIKGPAYPGYVETLAALGQKIGDVKPTALSAMAGWSKCFDGRYV